MGICDSYLIVKVFSMVNILLLIAKIGLPIILIVGGTIDFIKLGFNGSQDDFKKGLQKLGIRLLAVFMIFFLPTIVNIVMNLYSNYGGYPNPMCIFKVNKQDAENILINNATKAVYNAETTLNQYAYDTASGYVETLKDGQEKNDLRQRLANVKSQISAINKGNAVPPLSVISDYDNYTSPSGKVIKGQAYQITDEQIKQLTGACVGEQGSNINAIKYEASLMCNLTDESNEFSNVYNYVTNSGWFAGSTLATATASPPKDTVNGTKITNDMISAVKDVIVNGNRVTDANEHDCFGDIMKLVNLETCESHTSSGDNGMCGTHDTYIKNRSNYKAGVTVIYNKYGAIYLFSAFPSESSDPFGKKISEKEVKEKCPNA